VQLSACRSDIADLYIQIKTYAQIRLKYQSLEDFRGAEDYVRCSELFQSRVRFDSVMVNTETTRFGRLEGLFRCYLPSGRIQDVALLQTFKSSSWRPRTDYAGCVVLDLSEGMFVAPQYLVRGAVLVDTDLRELTGQRAIVNDAFDSDMFLRMGN
jgi:hypothetical protein